MIEPGRPTRAVTFVVIMLVDCRAYPLFAALFGYGPVMIMTRAHEWGGHQNGPGDWSAGGLRC